MSKRKTNRAAVPNSNRRARPKKINRATVNLAVMTAIMLFAVMGFGALLNARFAPRSGNTPASAQPVSTPEYAANKPSKEYIYAGGKLVAVSEPLSTPPIDLAVWRLSTGTWWVLDQDGSNTTEAFGLSTDLAAPGDYDGDGKTDFCVYRPTEGKWYLLQSGNGNTQAVQTFGNNGDRPFPADYNGDGKTEFALFRPSNNTWYLQDTTQGYLGSWAFGATGDVPVPADYDGDGKADLAVWRENPDTTATWYVLQSSDSSWLVQAWGASGDKPVPGDYDGDAKTDFAVWQASNSWYIRKSSTGAASSPSTSWGYQASDFSVQGDYDADGKTDIAVWRPSNGTWYIIESTRGQRIQTWGVDGDIPVPAPYRR